MGFLKPKVPTPPPTPKQPEAADAVDPLMEERLRKQRSRGRMASFLSQESQIGEGTVL